MRAEEGDLKRGGSRPMFLDRIHITQAFLRRPFMAQFYVVSVTIQVGLILSSSSEGVLMQFRKYSSGARERKTNQDQDDGDRNGA